MQTSFQKKVRSKGLQIPGTRPSVHNNQLLVSTGVPSLDNVIGGGVAVGTVILVEEDVYGSYGRLLLKYFLAEGVMSNHAILLAGAGADTDQLMKDLPGPVLDDPEPAPKPDGSKTSMQIAWRYQNMPQAQSVPGGGTKFGHYYDLTKNMDQERINATKMKILNLFKDSLPDSSVPMNPSYSEMLQEIDSELKQGQFLTSDTPAQRNILRIGIHSLGGPLWRENGGVESATGYDPSLPRFLYALRSLMRQAFAVCFITMPTHLFEDPAFTKRIEKLTDTVVQLDSFVGSDKEKNPVFREYHGLFNIIQLPRLNSLTCHMPDTLDLAFKLKRKKFTIERLHLPPELSDAASRPQEDATPKVIQGQSPCGTGQGSSKLDF